MEIMRSLLRAVAEWIFEWILIVVLVIAVTNYPVGFARVSDMVSGTVANFTARQFELGLGWQMLLKSAGTILGFMALFMCLKLGVKLAAVTLWGRLRRRPQRR